MKKALLLALTAILLVGCVFSLASCQKKSVYPKLEKAFIEEDFELVEELDTVTDKIKSELEKEELVIELHLLVRKELLDPGTALIIEFKTTDELVEAYEDSATLRGFVQDVKEDEDAQAFYDALVEHGYAAGNCLIVPIINGDDVRDIVKSVS